MKNDKNINKIIIPIVPNRLHNVSLVNFVSLSLIFQL